MESGFRDVAAALKTQSRGFPRLFGRMLFPHFCVSCGEEGSLVCSACRDAIAVPPSGIFACPSCGMATPFGSRCPSRRCAGTALDGLVSAAPYADRVLRELLHLYKYERLDEARDEIRRAFAAFLNRTAASLGTVLRGARAASVPLHFLRRAERGFNQSDFLADCVAEAFGLPRSRDSLRRQATWNPQARMRDIAARKRNVGGAFLARRRGSGGDWVVVDDVATSGATLEDCARALKAAGAGRVWGISLLRG